MRKSDMQGLWAIRRRFTTSKSLILFISFLAISGRRRPQGPAIATVKFDTYPHRTEAPLNYTVYGCTGTCSTLYDEKEEDHEQPPGATCPEYFRWIHEDLKPWAREGITRESLERARMGAYFRLVIVNGKAYVEKYRDSYQTRDVISLWGFLQLLRKYPGKVPDLELMFDCADWPEFDENGVDAANGTDQLPLLFPKLVLFRYCGSDDTNYITFPDWTFWGWPELNIKPWDDLLKDIKEGNKRSRWIDREPYAYWRGNPFVHEVRHQLMRCNISYKQKHDWSILLYPLNWTEELGSEFKATNVANQCHHRYKIYIEGRAWSVSGKYIFVCDSPTLYVKSRYYDFFTRSMMPMQHFWPIKDDDQCKSIKFAVEWGNIHKQKAQEIGKAASEFMQEKVKMEYVYDYMFHLLNEYAKLLKFKPTIPQDAVEVCSETLACSQEGLHRKFMEESLVKSPRRRPCAMPPPYDPPSLNAILRRKSNSFKQVGVWEKSYWNKQPKHK
ncbi:hypothetical protein L484_001024 [Morus notabilis]|uniref:Glycosyl transferase CAP10 domain-containing protein n=1 Tax=Morus notabilis TaxID=981085 RepID=W9QDL2_9ROSA|nr:hypothetical protein L484_001024 [Morus notabilis]